MTLGEEMFSYANGHKPPTSLQSKSKQKDEIGSEPPTIRAKAEIELRF